MKSIWATTSEELMRQHKPADQVFDISELANGQIYADAKHLAYSQAMDSYSKQKSQDLHEQVFLLVGTSQIPYVGPLVYLGLSQFYAGRKQTKAQSLMHARKFDSCSSPAQLLNDKNYLVWWDKTWLSGHCGEYYTEALGNSDIKAYVVVAPYESSMFMGSLNRDTRNFNWFLMNSELPSLMRTDSDRFISYNRELDSVRGYVIYWKDKTALSPYERKYMVKEQRRIVGPEYLYFGLIKIPTSDWIKRDKFNNYRGTTKIWENTAGGVIQLAQKKGYKYDTLRPTITDSAPLYRFANSSDLGYATTASLKPLHKPLVVSNARYAKLNSSGSSIDVQGILSFKVQMEGSTVEGIDSTDLTAYEARSHGAKIVLNKAGFGYPISEVSIDIVKVRQLESGDGDLPQEPEEGAVYHVDSGGDTILVEEIILPEESYTVKDGILYFTKPLDQLVDISDRLSSLDESPEELYYAVRVVFERIIPESAEGAQKLALVQESRFAIMDYFAQHQTGIQNGMMSADKDYTIELTFWSTIIGMSLSIGTSALSSAISAGKEGITQVIKALKTMTMKALIKAAVIKASIVVATVAATTIAEVFEETIIDYAIESWMEHKAKTLGWGNKLESWMSAILTTIREYAIGALGKSIKIVSPDTRLSISKLFARLTGDTKLQNNIQNKTISTV